MTANRRIFWNFVATYGRSVYSIIIGLLCGRWTLMTLGEVDYGLMGLIGGLTAFLSFFNSLMADAVGRFFAYSVGQAQRDAQDGLEECRKWFNIALLIHAVVPVIGVVIGYPIGVVAIERFLTIPPDRIHDCIWVWRWVCLSCFLTMVSLPFNAMYQAKQYIAELTIYSFATTTLNALFLYYMVTHPGVWLVTLSFWSCLLTIMPQVIIATRAFYIFPECRVRIGYLWCWSRLKELSHYAFFRFFGALAIMVKRQGIDILINKYLGPSKNAAFNIAGTVSGHCNSLGASFLGALSPAITNAYGAGNMERVYKLSYAACKYSVVMVLIFIVPLLLEADYVFKLWLVSPPEGTVPLCLCLLLTLALENITCGLFIPIFADGRIKGYQISCLICGVSAVPVAWTFLASGFGIVAIGYTILICQMIVVLIRLYFSRRICKFSVRKWVFQIALPVFIVGIISLGGGYVVRQLLDSSFVRLVLTTASVNLVLLSLTYLIVLDGEERCLLMQKVKSWRTRRGGGI